MLTLREKGFNHDNVLSNLRVCINRINVSVNCIPNHFPDFETFVRKKFVTNLISYRLRVHRP